MKKTKKKIQKKRKDGFKLKHLFWLVFWIGLCIWAFSSTPAPGGGFLGQ